MKRSNKIQQASKDATIQMHHGNSPLHIEEFTLQSQAVLRTAQNLKVNKSFSGTEQRYQKEGYATIA